MERSTNWQVEVVPRPCHKKSKGVSFTDYSWNTKEVRRKGENIDFSPTCPLYSLWALGVYPLSVVNGQEDIFLPLTHRGHRGFCFYPIGHLLSFGFDLAPELFMGDPPGLLNLLPTLSQNRLELGGVGQC